MALVSALLQACSAAPPSVASPLGEIPDVTALGDDWYHLDEGQVGTSSKDRVAAIASRDCYIDQIASLRYQLFIHCAPSTTPQNDAETNP